MSKHTTEKGSHSPAHKRDGEGFTDWKALSKLTDEEINARRKGDPNFDLDVDWDSVEVVMPVAKKPVSIRLDSDVIDFFKENGRGYQSRINAVLRAYMEQKKAS